MGNIGADGKYILRYISRWSQNRNFKTALRIIKSYSHNSDVGLVVEPTVETTQLTGNGTKRGIDNSDKLKHRQLRRKSGA